MVKSSQGSSSGASVRSGLTLTLCFKVIIEVRRVSPRLPSTTLWLCNTGKLGGVLASRARVRVTCLSVWQLS
jgi:hypothetical protein